MAFSTTPTTPTVLGNSRRAFLGFQRFSRPTVPTTSTGNFLPLTNGPWNPPGMPPHNPFLHSAVHWCSLPESNPWGIIGDGRPARTRAIGASEPVSANIPAPSTDGPDPRPSQQQQQQQEQRPSSPTEAAPQSASPSPPGKKGKGKAPDRPSPPPTPPPSPIDTSPPTPNNPAATYRHLPTPPPSANSDPPTTSAHVAHATAPSTETLHANAAAIIPPPSQQIDLALARQDAIAAWHDRQQHTLLDARDYQRRRLARVGVWMFQRWIRRERCMRVRVLMQEVLEVEMGRVGGRVL
ncbi:MAG: hypothetical protein Q9182_003221 [Xanthomendoza sp. 2 TL-2023]